MSEIQERIKRFLNKFAPPAPSSSSRKGGRGGVRNAHSHQSRGFGFKIDFKNAFPTTDARLLVPDIVKRVRARLPDSPGETEWLEFLSRYTLSKNWTIPHGALTSSILFEWYCEVFVDAHIRKLCQKWKIHVTYTRYVDDLVFTSFERLGKETKRAMIREIIADAGFRENHKKTEVVQLRSTRLRITGIGVGGKDPLSIPRAWLKETEKILFQTNSLGPLFCGHEPQAIEGRVLYLLDVLRRKNTVTTLERKILRQYIKYAKVAGVDCEWAKITLKNKALCR